MKTNIIVVSLLPRKCKDFAHKLSNELDMFFLDVNDLLEYQIINLHDMENKCGIDYLESQEKKVLNSLNDYENTILSIDYDLLKKSNLLKKTDDYNIIYVYFDKNQIEEFSLNDNLFNIASLIDFKNRNSYLNKISDIVIKYNETKNEMSKIKNRLI